MRRGKFAYHTYPRRSSLSSLTVISIICLHSYVLLATRRPILILDSPQPRFAIVPKHEHKAFIPYTHLFAPIPAPHSHAVIQAKAINVDSHRVYLDRPAWQGRKEVEYEFLVVASGTRLPSPGSMQDDHKLGGVGFFQTYQAGVQRSEEIVIVGGGAVGVQMALDMKEVYPGKSVTLVHSRERVMNRFHKALDGIVRKRCEELGVQLVTGQRVVMPEQGFPTDGTPTEVQLTDGRKIPADLVILATGQIPNTQLLQTLDSTTTDPSTSIINPSNGFLRVRPTLQLLNPQYPHIFALGDVADTGAPKAARPGMMQADVMVQNVLSLIEGKEAEKEIEVGPAAIHLTLGLVSPLAICFSDNMLIQSSGGRRRTSSSGIPSNQVANQ